MQARSNLATAGVINHGRDKMFQSVPMPEQQAHGHGPQSKGKNLPPLLHLNNESKGPPMPAQKRLNPLLNKQIFQLQLDRLQGGANQGRPGGAIQPRAATVAQPSAVAESHRRKYTKSVNY